ncbi:hypothetical protein WMF26_48040 [Sorangium sp. So ce185]|uniref:hypothetical protein n=1 Tax=Sorangium sp. So ce185 TaxID=3133287 RepID=UPI003F6154CA
MRTLRPSHVIAGAIAAGLSLLAAPSAAGEVLPGGARLSYARDPAAAACPDEEGFRDALATRLGGVDPFSPDGAWRVEVALARRAHAFEAAIALYDGGGQLRGEQERSASDCRALVDDVTLTLSVAMRSHLAPSAPDAPSDRARIAAPPARTAEGVFDTAPSLLLHGRHPGTDTLMNALSSASGRVSTPEQRLTRAAAPWPPRCEGGCNAARSAMCAPGAHPAVDVPGLRARAGGV